MTGSKGGSLGRKPKKPKQGQSDTPTAGIADALNAMLGLEKLLQGAPGDMDAGLIAQLTHLGPDAEALGALVNELQARYPSGAMLINASGRVVAITDAMSSLLELDIGANIFEHEWDADTQAAVRRSVKELANTLDKSAELVQLSTEGRSRLAAIEPYTASTTGPLLLLRLVGQPWHDQLSARLKATFKLSNAEVEIIRSIYLGLRTRDIAKQRERSIDTVRTQVKNALRKTNSASQSDLISTIAAMSLEVRPVARANGTEVIRCKDGTDIAFASYGAPNGSPVLMFHTSSDPSIGEARMKAVAQAGLRVIAPLRKANANAIGQDQLFAEYADAAARLLTVLGIKRCLVAGHREGGIYAANFASRYPEIATGVLAIDTTVPAEGYPMDELPPGAGHLIGVTKNYPFAAQTAFRLIRRVVDSGDAGADYVFDLLNPDDPADTRDHNEPEIRAIAMQNYRFAYADSALLVRHICLWYSDWSRTAEEVIARIPLRFVQGDMNCVLPSAPLEDFCQQKTNASFKIAKGAGQCLLYTHTALVIAEMLALCDAGRE